MTRILVIALLLTSCASQPKETVEVERIASAHRKDLLLMLSEYPDTTMDMLQTIAIQEDKIQGRKPMVPHKNYRVNAKP